MNRNKTEFFLTKENCFLSLINFVRQQSMFDVFALVLDMSKTELYILPNLYWVEKEFTQYIKDLQQSLSDDMTMSNPSVHLIKASCIPLSHVYHWCSFFYQSLFFSHKWHKAVFLMHPFTWDNIRSQVSLYTDAQYLHDYNI